LGLLRRYAPNLVLALDADEAGQRAAERALETVMELQRQAQTARWQRARQGRAEVASLAGEVRVTTWHAGTDHNDLLRKSPERWEDMIAQAQPEVDFMIAQQLRHVDLSDGAQKTRAVASILPMIAELESTVLRDHYLQKLARL